MAKSKIQRGVTDRGIVITRTHLADLLSLQVDTVSSLHKQGLFDSSIATEAERHDSGIDATNKNCYWSADAINLYYQYRPASSDSAAILDAKARKEEAEAVLAEVKAALAIKEVASLDDIVRITGSTLTIFKEGVLSLSSSVIAELIVADTPEQMRNIIDREAKVILDQLAIRFANLKDEVDYD